MKIRLYILLLIASLFFFGIEGAKLYVLMITWACMMGFCLCDIEKRLTLFSFDLAIFTFLLTRLIIPMFYSNEYTESSLLYTMTFTDKAYDFMSTAIFISLIASFVGFVRVKQPCYSGTRIDRDSRSVKRVRKITRKLVFFTSFFFMLNILDKILYVGQNGYESLYLSFESRLPSICIKFINIYTLVFYIFLATLPSKEEAKKPIQIFISLGVLSLFTGARGDFILNIILIVVYLFLRNQISPDDLWIGKRGKMILMIGAPSICVLMFVIMLIRGGSNTDGYDVMSLFVDFFFQQGSSMQVLGLTFDAQNNIPPDKFYSFGTLIDNYYNNFLFHLLGIAKSYKSNTPEYAIYGHSLANYLTYTYQPERFLNGGGMGSSYIAEVWNDFGYIGLFVWSYLYGTILGKFYQWARKNMWYLGLSFYMLVGIVFSPRASAIDFIADILSPTNILVIFLIYQYGKRNVAK